MDHWFGPWQEISPWGALLVNMHVKLASLGFSGQVEKWLNISHNCRRQHIQTCSIIQYHSYGPLICSVAGNITRGALLVNMHVKLASLGFSGQVDKWLNISHNCRRQHIQTCSIIQHHSYGPLIWSMAGNITRGALLVNMHVKLV